jgi:glutamate-ammonia-ligase adenylyltransferase
VQHKIIEFNRDLIPRPADAQQAQSGLSRWLEKLGQDSDQDLLAAESISADPDGRLLCDAIFGNSKYLTHCAVNEPEYFFNLLTLGPEFCFQKTIDILNRLLHQKNKFDELAVNLRQAKTQAALAIAFADVITQWGPIQVTEALTEVADYAVKCAVRFGLLQLAEKGAIELRNPAVPEEGSGLIVLGMGKLGAGELNYSSDIDIIILFDPDRIQTRSPGELQKHFVRLSQSLMKLLDERTAGGYVFRTDLRLRPDPGSTPIAISTKSARVYYATRARNWERAAFIKARAIAGDIKAGISFLEEMQTFIWKSDLDFSSVREIRTIKRQIDEHKNHGAIKVSGHNVKLGRGGIREIEFICQAQQLVWGGRRKNIRCLKTIDTLEVLAAEEKISKKQATDLTKAYLFLRRVEHRIQMTNDEQTHSIPVDEKGIEELALFMGYEDSQTFESSLLAQLVLVDNLFVHTFETSLLPQGKELLSDFSLFSAADPSEAIKDVLTNLGFSDPHTTYRTISMWLGESQIGANAKHKLTELLPTLLRLFGGLEEPDSALERLNQLFIRNLDDDHLYSLIVENPQLIGTLAIIMDCAPGLANQLNDDPKLLESVILYDFFDPIPVLKDLELEIILLVADAIGAEDFTRMLFRWSHDRKFQVAVQTLGGMIDHHAATRAYFDITQCTFQVLVNSDQFWSNGEMTPFKDDLLALAYNERGKSGMQWFPEYKLVVVFKNIHDAALKNIFTTWNEILMVAAASRFGIADLVVLKEENYLSEHIGLPGRVSTHDRPLVIRSERFLDELQAKIIKGYDKAAIVESFRIELLQSRPASGFDETSSHTDILISLPLWIEFLTSTANYLCLKGEQDLKILIYAGQLFKFEVLRDNEFIDEYIANDLIVVLEKLSAIDNLMSMSQLEVESQLLPGNIPRALKTKMAKVLDVADFAVVMDVLADSIRLANDHILTLAGNP